MAVLERSVQIDLAKDLHPTTIKNLTPKVVDKIIKKLQTELKKKDKNIRIEK